MPAMASRMVAEDNETMADIGPLLVILAVCLLILALIL